MHIRMTTEEHRRLREMAAAVGCSVSEIVRRLAACAADEVLRIEWLTRTN